MPDDRDLLVACQWLTETAIRDQDVKVILAGTLQRTGAKDLRELAEEHSDDFWLMYETARSLLEQLPSDELA
jgi:hypothetical protein